MSHRFFVRVVIQVRFEKTGGQVARRIEKPGNAFRAELELIAGGRTENFNTIAGRDDQSFTNDVAIDELAQAHGARFVVESESFADLYRSGFVIDSDEKNGHVFSHKTHKGSKRVHLKT